MMFQSQDPSQPSQFNAQYWAADGGGQIALLAKCPAAWLRRHLDRHRAAVKEGRTIGARPGRPQPRCSPAVSGQDHCRDGDQACLDSRGKNRFDDAHEPHLARHHRSDPWMERHKKLDIGPEGVRRCRKLPARSSAPRPIRSTNTRAGIVHSFKQLIKLRFSSINARRTPTSRRRGTAPRPASNQLAAARPACSDSLYYYTAMASFCAHATYCPLRKRMRRISC
jgi:hypothetical protein